jgi:hypothetical protein
MNALFLDLVSFLIFWSSLEHLVVELQTTIIHRVMLWDAILPTASIPYWRDTFRTAVSSVAR